MIMKRYMVWKDIHSFFRDFRSFLLLFLTPVLITVLVGSLFMSSGAKDIPIIVCTNSTTSVYNNTLAMIRGSDVFIIHERVGNCTEQIGNSLKAGTIRAGIAVPEVELGSTIEIYVDNTKPIGTFLQSYFNLISRDISNRLINTYIARTFQSIESNKNQISELESAINSLDSELAKIENDAAAAHEAAGTIQSSLSLVAARSGNIKATATAMRTYTNSLSSLAGSLGYVEIVDDIGGLNNYINSVESDADAMSTSAAAPDEQALDNRLDSMEYSVGRLRDYLDDIKGNTDFIKAVLSQLMTDMPQYSDPVKSSIVGYFGDKKYINFIFPSILIMIVMWMATFLSSINFIRQKSRGILRRIYVSPMDTKTIVVEKIAANAIISLVPLPFILAISFFILGIDMSPITAVLVFLAAALSVVVFSIIGLIIGSFSKTESTAILGSLIIIIPLMFMSGSLYPVEAFPAFIKPFTDFLPINTGVRLVEGFLFYSFDWVELLFLIYMMAFYMLVLTGVCWLFMRRSLKS